MTRHRMIATALVLAVGVLGQTGIATAQGEDSSPTPAGTPGGAGTTAAADGDAGSTGTPPPNEPPVAKPDSYTVVAGTTTTLQVLVNDTDDGIGRPAGEPPHLEIADGYGRLTRRVTRDSSRTAFSFKAVAGDAGRTMTFDYRAHDGELASNPVTVTVKVTAPPVRKVTVGMASTVVALRHYTVHGTVRPSVPTPVRVVVQRYYGGAWHRYKVDRADARGRYAVPFRTNRPRRYVFRAVATWDDGRRSASRRIARSVVARPDVVVSGPLKRSQVPHSWRSGCPVPPRGLRRITINRFNYQHVVARGSLVVRAGAVHDVLTVFRASFAARFPVRSMRPANVFYAGGRRTPTQSDVAAMKAGNTSAFNCRPVTGNPYRVSQHSYGNAIDINTVRNPYVVGGRVYPSWARTYLNRSHVRKGMITRKGVIATRMRRLGWPWGARWSHPDYQHFSANGG